jgi:hypothetical protein
MKKLNFNLMWNFEKIAKAELSEREMITIFRCSLSYPLWLHTRGTYPEPLE